MTEKHKKPTADKSTTTETLKDVKKTTSASATGKTKSKKSSHEKITGDEKDTKGSVVSDADIQPDTATTEADVKTARMHPDENIPEEVAESPVISEIVTDQPAEKTITGTEEEVSAATTGATGTEDAHDTKAATETQQEETKEITDGHGLTAEHAEMPSREHEKADVFDWERYKDGDEDYTRDQRSEYEILYDKTLSTVAENEVVDGTVIAMSKREVVINIGYKSEGVVSLNEFRYNPELNIGDMVEVYVESKEDKKGQLILSHKKARAMRSWNRVNDALDKDEIIKGYIKCRTKGGMIVDVFGIEAFLPGSQIDVKPIRDYDAFVGKTMEFKVVKINHEYKNVVVSHKALIEEELEQQKKEIIAKLEKGQVLEGTVKNITSYGVFIDLGGVDGLIHITDLSWGRVNHPVEIVQLDQKLNVVILDFDDDKKRIALGLKQLNASSVGFPES